MLGPTIFWLVLAALIVGAVVGLGNFVSGLFQRLDKTQETLERMNREMLELRKKAAAPGARVEETIPEVVVPATPPPVVEIVPVEPPPVAPQPVVVPEVVPEVPEVVTPEVVSKRKIPLPFDSYDDPVKEPEPSEFEKRASELFQKGWNWFWLGKEKLEEGDDLEHIVASNWLTRLGIIILVIGIGFFVQYSIKAGWVSEEVRMAGCALLGLVMYGVGQKLWSGKLNLTGQGLSAGGAAVMYFTCYASYAFYDLIYPEAAAIGACLITVLLVISALRRESQLLATLGMLGAYGTPYVMFHIFKVSHETPYPLLAYLGILAVGLLVIRRRKEWMIPVWIAFAGTLYFFWTLYRNSAMATDYNTLLLVSGALLFLAFHGIAQRKIFQRTDPGTFWELGMVGVNVLFFACVLVSLCKHAPEEVLYGFPLENVLETLIFGALSVPFFGMAWQMREKVEGNRLFWSVNCGIGFSCLALMFCLICTEHWLLSMLMLETLVALVVVQRAESPALIALAQLAGILLMTYGCLYQMMAQYNLRLDQFWHAAPAWMRPENIPMANVDWWNRIVRFLVPVLCSFGMAWASLHHLKNKVREFDTTSLTLVVGVLSMLVFLTAEINLGFFTFLPDMRLGALSVLWTLFALGMILVGMKFQSKTIRIAALVFFGLIIAKVFFVDLSELDKIYRIIAFIVLGVLVLGGGVMYLLNKKIEPDSMEEIEKK